jgi:hypothetical protein
MYKNRKDEFLVGKITVLLSNKYEDNNFREEISI